MSVIKWTAMVLGLTMAWAGAQRVSANALPSKSVLTLEAAKRVGAAAEAEAKKRDATIAIVVVDDGGHVI